MQEDDTSIPKERAVIPVEFSNKGISELVTTLTGEKPIKNEQGIDMRDILFYKDLALLLCKHFDKDISLVKSDLEHYSIIRVGIYEKAQLLLKLFPHIAYEQMVHPFMIKILENMDEQTMIQIKKDGIEFDKIELPSTYPISLDLLDNYIKQTPYLLRNKIFNQVLSYTYITNNLRETCPEVHKGMKVSLLDAGGIVLVGKNATSYTKAEWAVHSSLFSINGKRNKFGFLSDLYQDIVSKANKKRKDIKQQHGFPLDKEGRQKLITYIKTIHPGLVTDVSFHNGFCSIYIAGDITYKDNDDDAIKLDRWSIDDEEAKEMFKLANDRLDILALNSLEKDINPVYN